MEISLGLTLGLTLGFYEADDFVKTRWKFVSFYF